MARKTGASGLTNQQTGVSLAQSGGRNSTFGGGKGGTKETKGSTTNKRIGEGRLNSGSSYTLRAEAGNNAPVPAKRHVGHPPPVHPGTSAVTKTRFPVIKKPTRGGSS